MIMLFESTFQNSLDSGNKITERITDNITMAVIDIYGLNERTKSLQYLFMCSIIMRWQRNNIYEKGDNNLKNRILKIFEHRLVVSKSLNTIYENGIEKNAPNIPNLSCPT